MDFDESTCPPAVIEYVQTVDLASSDNSTLFSWIASNSDLECQVSSVAAIAERLDETSHVQVVNDFCASAATYARIIGPEEREKIRDAYLRMPYDSSIAMNYFAGLRLNQIDVRPYLAGKIIENWMFTNPRQDAETWHYYLYLASMGQPEAYVAIEKKLAATENGNDATNLLKSLSDVRTEQTRAILLKYTQDMRHAEAPDGPGLTIAETVTSILDAYFEAK